MTAYADFLDLRTEVVEYIGDPSIVDVFPRLVALAETALNRALRCREQISSSTLTFSSGSASLPSDFLEAIGLYDSSGYEYVQQPPQSLQFTSGTSTFYAVLASSIIMTGADGDRTLQYYAKIPSVGDSMDDSNWLLQKHPALYMWAVSLEAAKWKKDAALIQSIQPMLSAELGAVRAQDDAERYSRGRVRVAGPTP